MEGRWLGDVLVWEIWRELANGKLGNLGKNREKKVILALFVIILVPENPILNRTSQLWFSDIFTNKLDKQYSNQTQ